MNTGAPKETFNEHIRYGLYVYMLCIMYVHTHRQKAIKRTVPAPALKPSYRYDHALKYRHASLFVFSPPAIIIITAINSAVWAVFHGTDKCWEKFSEQLQKCE